MQEEIVTPEIPITMDVYVANSVATLWEIDNALVKFARAYMQGQLSINPDDPEEHKLAMDIAMETGTDLFTEDDVYAELANEEILRLSVNNLIAKLRSEEAVTRSHALHSPSIMGAIQRVKKLAEKRDGRAVEMDVSIHTDALGAPF